MHTFGTTMLAFKWLLVAKEYRRMPPCSLAARGIFKPISNKRQLNSHHFPSLSFDQIKSDMKKKQISPLLQKISLLLFIGLGYLNAKSQHTPFPEFSLLWGDRDSTKIESAEKVILSQDGAFIIAGQWQDSAWVKKVNTCGNAIWEKKFLVGAESGLSSICELPNGSLAAIGTCDDCAIGDTSRKAYVVWMDHAGNILRDTTLGVLNLDAKGNDIVRLRNGNIAVTGTAVMNQGWGFCDVLTAIFDTNLNLVRYGLIHKTFYNVGNRIVATQDSGFAISGYTHTVLFAPTHASIFKCDALGDTLWVAEDTSNQSSYFALDEMSNGDLIMVGSVLIDTVLKNQGYITIVNGATGQISSPQYYGTSGHDDEFHDIHVVSDGFLVGGQYGRPSDTGYGGRGWVFHLSPSFVVSDEVFNDEYLVNIKLRSIVPLSPKGEEWTTVSWRSPYYGRDVLWIKHHRIGREITLSKFPMDYQLYPRDSSTKGHVVIEGADALSGIQFDSVRVDEFRNDTLIDSLFQPLIYNAGFAPFNLQFHPAAMLANYHYKLYGVQNGTLYQEASACNVVAGDAYIITGGGNALGFSNDSTWINHLNPFVRNYGLKYADDTVYYWNTEIENSYYHQANLVGQWGLVLADQIVDNHHVPVAILNGTLPLTSIDSMLPTASSEYGKFLTRTIKAGLKDDFRGILFYQGEMNSNTIFRDSVPSYYSKFKLLYNAWNADFLNREHDFLFQIRESIFPGLVSLSGLQIAEAQRQIADSFPNIEVMSTTGMKHDSLSFYYQNGWERAGNDMYRLVDRALYGAPFANNVDAPNINYAQFNCARTEVTIQMRDANDILTWYTGMEADFELIGSSVVAVVLGYIVGNEVHLILSGPASPGTTISFNSHARGDRCSVKNANGIGMLRFYKQSILPCVGIDDELANFNITVYPNPFSGETLQIELNAETAGSLDLALYSLDGKRLSAWELVHGVGVEQHAINLKVGSGVYMVKATNAEGQVQVFRIVKL